MQKQNCWEFKNCGREYGGARSIEMGVCQAATERRINGVHGGLNGGRACWVVAGTLCGGQVQGSFATKLANCKECDFYNVVSSEEGEGFVSSGDILTRMQ
jgi:hypothetical protein